VGELDDTLREAACRQAHKLAGSAGTFGFLAAGEMARELEHVLGRPEGVAADQFPRLADLVVGLRHALEAGPADPAPRPAPVTAGDLLVVGSDRERMQRLVDEAAARGLEASIALSPAAGHEVLERCRPRIVLLDPVLPGGIQAALAFLSDVSASVPVLVLTDPAGELDRVEVARCGGRGFLPRSLPVVGLIDYVVGLRERLRATETTILAVDDDPGILDAIRGLLEADGLTVELCSEPGRLWEELERVNPDLLMLDIEMPGVSGLELCRAVRNDPRWSALPVLILTARSEPGTAEDIFVAGADDYIAKPFGGRELGARIANRLERVRLLRALADTDHLTGLANRRRAAEAIDTFRLLSQRGGQALCLAVFDIDGLKRINQALGHAGGDAALRGVGRALAQHFRGEDIVSRWDGGEFVVGMFGMTTADGRQRVGEFVEQIRLAAFGADAGHRTTITVSAGLAELATAGGTGDVESLYRAADEALAAAKLAGGDRVRVAGQLDAVATVFDVVLVEDDEILGELLEHALVTRGYRLRRIPDGMQAVALLGGADPPVHAWVIVLDWDLPSLDGLSVLHALSEAGTLRQTRVIMLTGHATEGEVLETLEAGACDHVAKPFSVPVLMQRIRRALEHPPGDPSGPRPPARASP
jgi:diguanylate cyclase (GGDEF)-like protein